MALTTPRPDLAPTRDGDFYAWLAEQAAHARAGRIDRLDLSGIADEFEEIMGDKLQEIENRLVVLYQHLLKYEVQPDRRSGSWTGSIVEQRQRLRRLIRHNPSLGRALQAALADPDLYADARDRALAEAFASGLSLDLPEANPYTPEQVLDPEFWPGSGPHPELSDRQRRKLGLTR